MARRMLSGLCVALVFAGAGFGVQPSRAAATPALLVFGAASLANVLDELGVAYAKESGQAVKGSYASSSVLARQLEAGAPADIFLSADLEWMDQVQSHSLIKPATRRNLLANRLVLVAPSASDVRIRIASGFPLLAALRGGRLAVGDPDSVPAGKYARAALLSLGVWNQVVDHLARGDSVRSALTPPNASGEPTPISPVIRRLPSFSVLPESPAEASSRAVLGAPACTLARRC